MTYENRYYARIDLKTKQVIGWYDMATYTGDQIDSSELVPLTDDYWDQHISGPQSLLAYENGEFVPYTPPPPPLKTQAANALQQARLDVYNNYGILNEPTPAAWVSYLRALMAIANGTDTTSTTLPAAPSDDAT